MLYLAPRQPRKPLASFDQWIAKARQGIADQPKANGLTLRGFATDPNLPTFKDAYGLHAACISVYPMYKGVASLVGMEVIDFPGETPEDEFAREGPGARETLSVRNYPTQQAGGDRP